MISPAVEHRKEGIGKSSQKSYCRCQLIFTTATQTKLNNDELRTTFEYSESSSIACNRIGLANEHLIGAVECCEFGIIFSQTIDNDQKWVRTLFPLTTFTLARRLVV